MVSIDKKTRSSSPAKTTSSAVDIEEEQVPLTSSSPDGKNGADSGSSSKNSQKKQMSPAEYKDAAFWLCMLFLASVTILVGEKYVMQQWEFYYTLSLMQHGTAVLCYGMGNYYFGMMEMKPFAMQQWKVFAVSSFFLAMQILTSTKALSFVAIATFVAFRSTCMVIIAIIDYLFFGNKFTKPQVWSLVLTTAGMILYAVQDINFNAVGYLWLVGHYIALISNTFWNKFYITHYTKELKIQTSYGVSFIQQVETIPIAFVVLALANNEGQAYTDYGPLSLACKICIFATCAGGVLVGIAYPKCFSLVSGTSVEVANTANKAVSILIGMWLFGTRLSVLQVVGLFVCIVGSLWYALDGINPPRNKL